MSGWATGLPSWLVPNLWLDANHCVRFHTQTGFEGHTGCLFAHRKRDGEWCIGGFEWAGNGPTWQLVSLNPLHVEPSIRCLSCGCHGWVRGGKWERAGDDTSM